ncbi:hypothetical protein BB559_004439 [Furculomyces boomerangus]|uniref:Uncharacterized protein n=2 Tax=Harpellales TaxID=61421 RepID=A0A2T9Y5P0_9FUNG|nr:hypothetical protein BB559_005951 [Furculomyces boomerangus]PVU90792.1 hypothetical protein BB559_004439 [Furculomyces boomerangus]PVZ96530.1 hypothetical protein BB558_007551 [Smittium angustum]PWA03276.1 hypothetical protein BB558_000603 [Smittium angustum]
MEVTKTNFDQALSILSKDIKNASCISFDIEMTGIWDSEYTKLNILDNLEMRYLKAKAVAEKFQIAQFGICLFEWVNSDKTTEISDDISNSFSSQNGYLISQNHNQNNGKHNANPKKRLKIENTVTNGYYNAKPFNFYIFPKFKNGIFKQEKVFSMLNSGIEFLAENNFDFNKWIYQGIPYVAFNDIESLKNIKIKSANRCNKKIPIPEDKTMFVNNFKEKIDLFIKNPTENEITILTSNNYERRLVHQETNGIDGLYSMSQRGDIIIKKLSKEEIDQKIESQLTEINESSERSKGFTKVIELLINAKKTIIGHNCLLDLVFIYSHFFGKLPNTLSEFKMLIHAIFPRIYDTKHIFEQSPELKLSYPSSTLKAISETVTIFYNLEIGSMFSKYITSSLHEAGYDAYLTGLVYLKANIDSDLASRLVFLNKIYVFKSDPEFISITESDVEPTRPNVIICSSTKGRLDLEKLDNFMDNEMGIPEVDLYPISETSCFIHLQKFEKHHTLELMSKIINKKIYKDSLWKVETYTDFCSNLPPLYNDRNVVLF